MHIDTTVIHGAYSPDDLTGSTVAPIVQTVSFVHKTAEGLESIFEGREPGFVYSRISNPTVMAWERRMNALEGGIGAIACSSGMAAISTAIMTIAGSGDEIISGSSLFAGTYSLFAQTMKQYGIKIKFVDPTDIDGFKNAITDKTKAVFLEVIGNPMMDVPDISAVSEVARSANVALIVDNTSATPVITNPKQFGADIIIHSASKFINGHGNSIGGIIIDCGTFDWSGDRYEHLRSYVAKAGDYAFLAAIRNQYLRDLGACLSPFNAFLMSVGVESLAVRMQRHCESALSIAERLYTDCRVNDVRYPGLKEHRDYGIACRQFRSGYGALMTFRMGSKERCFKFINSLRLIQNSANLGDARTLVVHPSSTICSKMSSAEKQAVGVTDDLIRLCVGLEHVDDLWADMDQSIGKT